MSLILIVEDNEKNMKLVRDVLRVKGHETLEAVTAEDGIALARERRPDLVLMDIELPGMNGVDALKALRADAGTSGIPVAAVTASVMERDRSKIMAAGFDEYIAKPIELKSFLASVQRLLEQGRRDA